MWRLVIIAKKKKINLNCFRESEANKAKYAKQMAEQKKDAESSVSYILRLFMPLYKKQLSFVFRLSSIILTPKVHSRRSMLFPVTKTYKKLQSNSYTMLLLKIYSYIYIFKIYSYIIFLYLYVKLKRQLKHYLKELFIITLLLSTLSLPGRLS